eukprot:3293505-Amphidinium_carterae.1
MARARLTCARLVVVDIVSQCRGLHALMLWRVRHACCRADKDWTHAVAPFHGRLLDALHILMAP